MGKTREKRAGKPREMQAEQLTTLSGHPHTHTDTHKKQSLGEIGNTHRDTRLRQSQTI